MALHGMLGSPSQRQFDVGSPSRTLSETSQFSQLLSQVTSMASKESSGTSTTWVLPVQPVLSWVCPDGVPYRALRWRRIVAGAQPPAPSTHSHAVPVLSQKKPDSQSPPHVGNVSPQELPGMVVLVVGTVVVVVVVATAPDSS